MPNIQFSEIFSTPDTNTYSDAGFWGDRCDDTTCTHDCFVAGKTSVVQSLALDWDSRTVGFLSSKEDPITVIFGNKEHLPKFTCTESQNYHFYTKKDADPNAEALTVYFLRQDPTPCPRAKS